MEIKVSGATGQKTFYLLRGLARESRHWASFPEGLKKTYPGCEIKFLELPGAGSRYQETFPISLNSLFKDLTKQVQTKHENNFLIAISLGGMIALNWVKREPNIFKSLFIINSSARNLSAPWERFKPKNYKFFYRILSAKSAFMRELAILEMTSSLEKEKLLTQAKVYAGYHEQFPMRLRNIMKQLFLGAILKAPQSLNTALFFIVAKEDHLVDPSCSQKLADFYQTKLVSCDFGGHDLPLDNSAFILSHLKQNLDL